MSQRHQQHRRRIGRRLLAITVAILAVVLVAAEPAAAHTGFESSDPADGAVVTEPVDVVTITFTGEATPVGDEFVALNAAGELQEPIDVTTTDDRVFAVRFDPPLAGGRVGIRWNVQAADAHPIDGAFSFTVDAPAPTTTITTTTTLAPAVDEAADNTIETDTAPATSAPPEEPPATTAAEPVAAAEPTSTTPPPDTSASGTTLEEFLSVDATQPGETTATVGRVIGLIGVAVGLGALAFAATTLRGRRGEVTTMLIAVRALGVVIAVGAVIEYVGVSRIAGESLTEGWSTTSGFATVLRLIGGLGLAAGLAGTLTPTGPSAAAGARALSAMALDERPPAETSEGSPAPRLVRWIPDSRSWPALGGAAVILASFWFDGHTVSKGFRPLHALVNTVHVATGTVWVGGVLSMAAVLWMRTRRGEALRGAEMVVRFSKIATIALVAVLAAGAAMAFLVLDSFSELTSTEWGKILLLKSAAVGLAIVGGAYNHFRLLPALDADPDAPELQTELRSTVTAEAIVLVFVVTVTAWLVAAAS
ncbi:MAG: CopD family protein [Ilumatobacter sp.]|uniref:copper resistance CopC/CopD family protein n=1 Tax=Ilumatobacter sp. TaxID=1967498 RepID=UPI00260D3F99|nr:CopD family protein [Ilumatobacter sp.]MDJ0768141.1 CopD family protein [Ilumatobacter sp.]